MTSAHHGFLAASFSALFVIVMAIAIAIAAPSAAANERPNLLFIMADDHAANAISAYGGRLAEVAPTPHIDRIAKEGIRLGKCFVTNSICTPSRAVILSGQHSHLNTVLTLDDAFPGPEAGVPNVAAILQRGGYETVLFGKWHLRSEPWGFDFWKVGPGQGLYHDPVFQTSTDGRPYEPHRAKRMPRVKGYYTDLVTDDALDWLGRWHADQEAGTKRQPFFMMLHHKAPHGKWEPADRHRDYLAEVEIPEPATLWEDFSHRSEATREMGTSISRRNATRRNMVDDVQKENWPSGRIDMTGLSEKEKTQVAYQKYLKDYLRCVKAVDENVGRVLGWLDESGQAADTLLIYTSDQGMFLGEHDYFDKRWIYEECFRMPFVARWPGRIAPGTVEQERLCSNLDFAQTFLDAAGIDAAAAPAIVTMQGRSLLPVLEGKATPDWRSSVYYRYWMHLAHHYVPGHYGVRTNRYKLAFFHGRALGAVSEEQFPPTTAGWEFYDLESDPEEISNQYDNPEYAEIIAELKLELDRLKKQYRDEDDQFPELEALQDR